MKRITLAIVVLSAAVAQGQRPARPAAPTPPARPARPVPALAPDALDALDASQLSEDLLRTADAMTNIDIGLDVDNIRDQVRVAARAVRDIDMNQLREQMQMAREDARIALDGVRGGIFDGVDVGVLDGVPPVAPIAPMPPLPAMAFDYTPADRWMTVRPRSPWAQGDPADSLYRVARDTFNRGDYRRAAQIFANITEKFPRSAYANDAVYFEAYSRYRLGSTEDLKEAAKVLAPLANKTNDDSRRGRDLDAPALYARINHALALRGDREAAAVIEKQATQAGAPCDQEDLSVQAEALNALSQMDPSAAITPIRKVLARKDDCSASLRRNAVFILARRADTSAANLLLATAKSDPSVDVRANAIMWLPRVGGDAGIAALEDMLKSETDIRVQRAAVRALMTSDSPRARQSMKSLIERKDAPIELRLEALNSMNSDRTTAEDAGWLRSLFAQTDDERFKSTIVNVIARLGGSDNDQWLLSVAKNPNESTGVRATAIARLARSGLSIADLSKLYDQADSRGLRDQLIMAFANRPEPEATDKLVDIAKNGTDADMRRAAIRALSRKKDPRAQKAILDLIDKNP